MARDPQPEAPALAKARVLSAAWLAGALYPPDAVAELGEADLAEAVANGVVDPHPDAVAYAESLRG